MKFTQITQQPDSLFPMTEEGRGSLVVILTKLGYIVHSGATRHKTKKAGGIVTRWVKFAEPDREEESECSNT